MTTQPDPPASVLEEFLETHRDAQQMDVYCALCPSWSASGTVAETRIAAEEHRRDMHPETFLKRRKVRSRRVWSQALTKERKDEIDEERRQRMRSLGIG